MFVRDLERYRHGVPHELRDVVSIGWLSRVSEYPIGDVSPDFLHRLEALLASNRVNQMRGYHTCEFCSQAPLIHRLPSGREIILGSAEIWVPAADWSVVYAAPDMVYHYVARHRYLPPGGFLEAVAAAPRSPDWDATKECRMRLEGAFAD
jgi:hypothetical protein